MNLKRKINQKRFYGVYRINELSKKVYAKIGGEIIKYKDVEIENKQYKECCFEYDI